MKYKDLETKIRTEADGIDVPNVYSRVRKAPINSLLDGEAPRKAFRKRLAVMLLVLTLAIFAVMSLTLFAFAFRPRSDKAPPAPQTEHNFVFAYTQTETLFDKYNNL